MPGGVDPRQLAAMMKRMGIETRDIPNVQEIVVRTPGRDYVFSKANVSVMKAQGQETWQIVGTPRVVERNETSALTASPPATREPTTATPVAVPAAGPSAQPLPFTISDDDVKTVMQGAHCDAKTARAALEKAGGDLAQAIVDLTGA